MEEHAQFCLADYVPVLPGVAAVLRAEYESGSFEAAEEDFHRSGDSEQWWALEGTKGTLRIRFERYEGYYFAELSGEAEAIAEAREILESTHPNG